MGGDGPEVDRAALERALAGLADSLVDPAAGLFGPDSMLWEVNRHSVIFLGGGRAALMQLAHPAVAQAIAEHSRSLHDPLTRFQRTFANVFDMVYGPRDRAFAAARRVHAIHGRIRGRLPADASPDGVERPYLANDPEALLWVHSTLWDTSVRIFESLVRPLSESEKDRYCVETRRFAALFGIPETLLPDRWSDFMAYCERMESSEALRVTRAAREIADVLLAPRWVGTGPVMRWARGFVGAGLPPRLREGFGLPGGRPDEQRRHARDLRWLRALEPRLPDRLRYLPPYVAARRRLAGQEEFDRLGRLLGWIFVGSRLERGVRPSRGD